MALEQLKVKEIVRRAVNKDIDIPEFQRDFVWDPEQVKLLAESLYREFPVGAFLLWDSSAYQQAKTAEGEQASLWIVDGQQHTTASACSLGKSPTGGRTQRTGTGPSSATTRWQICCPTLSRKRSESSLA